MTRKVILKMQCSLDGYVGSTTGEADWVFSSIDEELEDWYVDLLRQAGAHLMGRVTYHEMAAHWPTSEEAYAEPMNTIPKIVFSKTLTDPAWDQTTVLGGDLATEIARLKDEPGDDLLAHGGAGFARSLINNGLVDEYRLTIHPVTLGAGLPLFDRRMDLKLVSSEPFPGGAVALTYAPA